MEHDIRRIRPKLPAGELTRLLFTQPYLRIENVVDAGLAQRQTASKWLNELATTGLIAKEKIGRNVVYINQKLLNELFTTPLPDQTAPSERSARRACLSEALRGPR